jgi:DTW domain-containing protein YfiP
VLILQHRRERFHPFNTARIVHQALGRSRLMVAHNAELASQFQRLTLSAKVGLLYPDVDAPVLTDLTRQQMPDQLVVIDGTWHQAKTLVRDIPRLRTLPKYRLAPSAPGQYQIRREPDKHALSTLEATVSALQSIEPETRGLDKLTGVFQRMISDQLGNKSSNWRKNLKRRRGSPNIPKLLAGDPANIVVAYGEREPGHRGDRKQRKHERLMPVYWVAVRLDGSERFECLIESDSLHDSTFLQHLNIEPAKLPTAVSMDQFRQRWRSFLRPNDRLLVDRQSTANLLSYSCAADTPCINLKSIDVDLTFRGIGSKLRDPAITRAHLRLAHTVELTHYLKDQVS